MDCSEQEPTLDNQAHPCIIWPVPMRSENDIRVKSQPRWQKENLAKNLALVEEVKGIAAEKGCKPGQLALAWVLHQGDDVFPIPGAESHPTILRCCMSCLSSAFEHARLRHGVLCIERAAAHK